MPADFLDAHLQGEWGQVDDEDRRLNDQALLDGSGLLSAYTTLRGVRLWIITGKRGTMDSDEALTGLMARHLWNGEFRAFMWRFNYQGTISTYPVALSTNVTNGVAEVTYQQVNPPLLFLHGRRDGAGQRYLVWIGLHIENEEELGQAVLKRPECPSYVGSIGAHCRREDDERDQGDSQSVLDHNRGEVNARSVPGEYGQAIETDIDCDKNGKREQYREHK